MTEATTRESGETTQNKDTELTPGKMGPFTLAHLQLTKSTVKDSTLGLMEEFIMENGTKERFMEMEFTLGPMANTTTANTTWTKNKEPVPTDGRTANNMKAAGLPANNTAKAK